MLSTKTKTEKLIGGYDSGSNTLKISYLNDLGNIESFGIATVIAEAPLSKVDLKASNKSKGKQNDLLDLLHVRVSSNNLHNTDKSKAWYVGNYAKNLENRIEPKINEDGKTEDKFSQQNKKLHLIPLFTGMAIAALKTGRETIEVPFSGGVPIEDYKVRGEQEILTMIFGEHIVEFLDGEFEGKSVKITIKEGSLNVEGVHTIMGLSFNISEFELEENKKIADKLNVDSVTIADLGGGTTDKALFEEGVLNKTLSTNTDIGTNFYIDSIIQKISELDHFKEVRESAKNKEDAKIFKTREAFINTLIAPEVKKMIEDKQYKPAFKVKWGFAPEIDVTDIVLEGMKEYFENQKQDLLSYWVETNSDVMVIVGGGLLFGYYYFKDLKEKYKGIIFPTDLYDSPYITSRSYLISNYLEQLPTEGE